MKSLNSTDDLNKLHSEESCFKYFQIFFFAKFIFVTEPTIQMFLNLGEPHLRTLRGDVTLFIKLNVIFPSSELLNEILCILVAQGAVKICKVGWSK